MSLTTCVQKAGDALRTEDKTAILDAARAYRASGMVADDAGRQAIRDQITAIRALLGDKADPLPDGKTTGAGGGTPTGDATPATPKPPKVQVTASDPLKTADVRKSIEAQDADTKAKFADADIKVLGGVHHAITKAGEAMHFTRNAGEPKKIDAAMGFASPGSENEYIAGSAKAAAAFMGRLIDGSDAAGIAELLYAGIRDVTPDDIPFVFPEDKMIRIAVKLEEVKALEAALKKLKLRITDRSQETDKAERMVLSAIQAPAEALGDSGEELGGKMKGRTPPTPTAADDKAVAAYMDALHPKNFLDPSANQEQSFAAMMFKEALYSNVRMPLDFLAEAMKKQARFSYGASDKEVIKASLAEATRKAQLERLAASYVERLQLLHKTLTKGATTMGAYADFQQEYFDSGEQKATASGAALGLISKSRPIPFAEKYAGRFVDDASTDQTHRVVKKDPDTPPRLDRIVRVGMKDHRNGLDVSGEEDANGETEFERTFGFKGKEFGEWVNNLERQTNLNLAYDSLMDLADLTGLSPKIVGLARRLGLAIGARGQKNTRAAAHFEPDSNVINLTKTQGNGTVGHEWFHGMDWNLAQAQNNGDYAGRDRATVLLRSLSSNLSMKWDVDNVEARLRGLLRDAAATKERNTPPKEAVFNAIRHDGSHYNRRAPIVYSDGRKNTRFYNAAISMDSGASKNYWSTPAEMLARGFESFLFDASKGGSPYLVGPTRAPGFMTGKNGYKGTAYPEAAEREYVAGLYTTFFEQIDPETLALKPFKVKASVVEVDGLGFAVVDQHHANVTGTEHQLSFYKTREDADKVATDRTGENAYLTPDRLMVGRMNEKILDVAKRIDAIMEEMGIIRWPEIKNGTMAESMFFHLRQGWWPENNAALIEYAAKAHRTDKGNIDRLKQKFAQEDFEAALGRYAAQRVVDMRTEGSDDKAIYDYLVDLYKKQPNLDVQTGDSIANQAYSTPIPIGFIVGLLTRLTSKSKVFDPTGGNGLLLVGANPKNVITIELEKRRVTNLGLMQYGRVIAGDSLKLMDEVRDQEADAVHANPPFGSLVKNQDVMSWNNVPYSLSKLDHLIAARSLRAMADSGRAVIILGAHREPGKVITTDVVFLNWLTANYNVVDHFEIDGKMYSRQGAGWPIRVLVIAGRNQTSTWYDKSAVIERVSNYDQLWSRFNEARARSEQIMVGARKPLDKAGGGNQDGAGIPPGDGGKAAGPGAGPGNAPGDGNGDVVDGVGTGNANGRPGATGGATAGNDKPGLDGQGGGAVDGKGGKPAGRTGRGSQSGGNDLGGLSDLDDDEIERLVNEALGGKKKAGTGATGGTTTGDAAPAGKKEKKTKPGKSILDGIEGLDELFGDIEKALNGNGTPPDDDPKPKKKKETALERRERLKAGAQDPAGNALTPRPDAPLQIAFNPSISLQDIGRIQYSSRQMARAMQAAMDYQTEQDNNPTAPLEKVSSRAMFSRQMAEDRQYATIKPMLAGVWAKLTAAITDRVARINTFVVGLKQKFGEATAKLAMRFLRDLRDEQAKVPDRKQPIKSEAIDNEAQVVYRGRSGGDSDGIFVPAKQAAALERAFDLFESKNGEVDAFVRTELGYADDAAMYKALGGYQIDGLALAISGMKDGNGFIIGDDTGVGKGRAAAALIAWSVKQGKIPIFFSLKDDLHSAMYDDLVDIDRGGTKILATNTDTEIKSRSGDTVLRYKKGEASAYVRHILDKGELPNGAQALFTTYSQISDPAKSGARRDAIHKLVREGKAVLILDEAHNSAGESNTNAYFMKMLTGVGLFGNDSNGDPIEEPDGWEAPPTVYLSATFAKRPSNMPVYVRTHLRHAADTPAELVSMFSTGGDVMQQIASEYLVDSGSMIRRERSYAGVSMNYVTDEANAPRDGRLVDQVTSALRQIVFADRAMKAWIDDADSRPVIDALIPPGSSITHVASQDRQLDKSLFTSVVHNYIGQLLLATKVSKAVELAVAALNRGEKPVFSLQNTMETAIKDYAKEDGINQGDPAPGFGWKSLLKRGMRSARRVTLKSGTGKSALKQHIFVPINVMPGYLAREFRRADELIAQLQTTLPGSPIDALRHMMGEYVSYTDAAGKVVYTKTPPAGAKTKPLVIREITGREETIDYSTPVPTLSRRKDPANVDMIRGYQGVYEGKNGRVSRNDPSTIDALIINSSGSTGISLHASVTATDQRPRHMFVLQPNPDIAVFKQTLGRIHRTGQVEWPFFTVLATGIPAERRLLAVLKKKIGTLFSNTSGGDGSTGVDAVDFINVYGDAITKAYLEENSDIAAFIAAKLDDEDLALKASGRASLLPIEDQQAYFDTIEERFVQEIEMRDATGTNVLNMREVDLQAEMTWESMLEEGMDETNKFTSSAFLRKYLINVVGDIPTSEAVRAAIASALNGRDAKTVVSELDDSLRTAYDEALNQNRLELASMTAELADAATTDQAKVQLTSRIGAKTAAIAAFSNRREMTLQKLRQEFPIGAQYDGMKVGDVSSQAVVIGYRVTKSSAKAGNPFAPSGFTIRFQRNVPGGPIGIALSKLEGHNDEIALSGRQNGYSDNIDDWFSLRNVSGGRQERYIANGNLLRARLNVEGGEVMLHTLQGSTQDAPSISAGIVLPGNWAPPPVNNTDFTIRYNKAGADYVLSIMYALQMSRYNSSGDQQDKDAADAILAKATFIEPIDHTDYTLMGRLSRVIIMRGGRDSFRLRTMGPTLRLTLDQGQAKLSRNKDLTAITGTFAKKRGDTEFVPPSGQYVTEAVDAARMVAILGRFGSLIVPEFGAEYAKSLQKKHFNADNGIAEQGAEPAALSRAAGGDKTGQPVAKVQQLVDAIAGRWAHAPKIVFVPSINDKRVPEDIRKQAAGNKSTDEAGATDGFFDKETGTVYLIADKLAGDADVVRVLMHESLGHFGLRGLYGAELGTILDRIAALNSGKVRAQAARLGYDFDDLEQRRMAAEEALAYMAQNTPEVGWVQNAVAAVRSWLRANIPGFSKMGLSDAELIHDYILPARRFVEDGAPSGPGGGRKSGNFTSPAPFSRSMGAALKAGVNNARDWKLPAGYAVSDLLESDGKLGWWHKTVGTMYHLAQKSPPFRRVYDSVQSFLGDVSYYAAEAADLAPNILPKLDSWQDITKTPLSPKDTKALSAPVFEGTLSWGRDERGVARPLDDIVADLGATSTDDKAHMLMRDKQIEPGVLRMWQGLPIDQYEAIINGKFERRYLKPGVVFTPKELKQHFKLDERQTALYQEFRTATDKSIDNLAISEMLRYAGDDADFIRAQVLGAANVTEAAELMRDQFLELAKSDSARNDALLAMASKMIDIGDHASDMKARGYAPLSRFGNYTLDATLESGERYFSLFESEAERNKMRRTLEAAGAEIQSAGTMSQEDYKLLKGVSPETVALFGEMLGLESQGDDAKDRAFQEYVRRGVANRSAMKRLMHRKGIAGFSEDAGRVLAGFVYSNGRRTASNLHQKELTRAVSDIPKEHGELKDAAVRLRDYVSNPQEEAQAFRAVLFAQYLGGSVASAIVNATQPFAVTFPYLTQFGGVRKAALQMSAAVRDATHASTGDARLDAALRHAEEAGIVSPQEVHALQAQAMGRAQLRSGDGTKAGNLLAAGNNALSKLSLAWSKVFGVAEQFNRRVTFIAAYRTAIDQKITDPAKFAEKAVAETQFTYNKGNKPRWARGVVGSTLFTFKQYSVNYVELLTRMATAGAPGSPERLAGQRAALLALAILFLMGGADGLPFIEDMQDVVDGALQRMGYNFGSKQKMKEFLAHQIGMGGAEFVMKGASGLPGMPIDFSGRLGMGNLIPGTGLFLKKTDHSRDLMEVTGVAGDLVKRGFAATEQALKGDIVKAATTISPVAARNVAKGIDMAATGMYRDDRGRKVIDTTPGEALAKAIGFQPNDVARVGEASYEVQRQKAGYILASAEIREKWARSIFEGDKSLLEDARDDIAAWNRKNPQQPMRANMPAILSRVKEMRKTKEQRVLDSTPKAIRERARAQLKEELA